MKERGRTSFHSRWGFSSPVWPGVFLQTEPQPSCGQRQVRPAAARGRGVVFARLEQRLRWSLYRHPACAQQPLMRHSVTPPPVSACGSWGLPAARRDGQTPRPTARPWGTPAPLP